MVNNPHKVEPRRPYYDEVPDYYLESDKDYVLNNLDACVWYLDNHELIQSAREAETTLLRKYMRYVRQREGSDFVNAIGCPGPEVRFTVEELARLKQLSSEVSRDIWAKED